MKCSTDRNNIRKIIENNCYVLEFVKKASPSFIFLTCAISLTAFVDTVSNTWFSKIVFDSMEQRSPFSILVVTILTLFFFMLLSQAVRTLFNQKYAPKENAKITGFIRSALYEKTRGLDYMYYENPEFYNTYTRALTQADTRALSVLSSVSQLSFSVITLVTLFLVIIYLDPVMVAFAIVGAFVSAAMAKKLSKIRYDYNYDKTLFDRKASYADRVFYEPQYAKEMKMDSIHFYFLDFYRKNLSDIVRFIRNRSGRIAFWEFLSGLQNIIMQSAMTFFLTWRVYSGLISIGDYAALLNSSYALMFQLQALAALLPAFYEHSLYIENLREIMDSEPVIEKDGGLEIDCGQPVEIEFCKVSFSYPGTEHVVLDKVDLHFSAGKKHAIVGHNGAGKSTIIKLILRLYDVDQGMILVNSRNIKEYNVFSLRRAVTTVFQDFQVYAVPVADYVLAHKYNEDTEKDKIAGALRDAGLSQEIQDGKLPFASTLTREFDESGIILSGGQTQKLAIARAIAKGAGTVIMDEASSALDPISEHEINSRLYEIAKGKTVIVISHRLSTTKDADQIYYMERGRVAESGSHRELMDSKGKYARMFELQANSFLEG